MSRSGKHGVVEMVMNLSRKERVVVVARQRCGGSDCGQVPCRSRLGRWRSREGRAWQYGKAGGCVQGVMWRRLGSVERCGRSCRGGGAGVAERGGRAMGCCCGRVLAGMEWMGVGNAKGVGVLGGVG